MLIRGIGKNLKSEAWLGTAGHHRGSRRRQRSLIYGASNWSLTLVVVVCIYGTQCMVGLLAGTPASICLRARLQDRTTICMACSAFFVISRMCRSVVSISLRGAALVSSFARSCTAANMARILPRSSRARWARSGRLISSCRPKSPWTKPSISWTRISAKAASPSRVAAYGHMVGDALLREVARRLQTAAEGAFLARIGGDEFVLILADGEQQATASALAD